MAWAHDWFFGMTKNKVEHKFETWWMPPKILQCSFKKKEMFINQLFTWIFNQELGFFIILNGIWDIKCVPNWVFIFQLDSFNKDPIYL